MAKTRLEYRTGILSAADMSGLVDSTELNPIVQEECEELYNRLVEAFEDYNVTISGELTPSAGTDYVSLPADFHKLRAVDWKQADNTFTDMERFELTERNDLYTQRYTLMGDRLLIRPQELAPSTTVRVYYVPTCPQFSDDVATPFNDRGFYKRVFLSGAIRLKAIAEKSTSDLERQLAAIDKQLEKARSQRDSNKPKRMVDNRRGLEYAIRRGWTGEDI